MGSEGSDGNLLEEAKSKAIEIGSAYKNGADLRLLTNDFDPTHFRSLSFEEFKNEVSKIQSSASNRMFDDVASRASSMFDAYEQSSLYYLSDLQTVTSTPTSATDSLLSIYVVPIKAELKNNLYVDSCWFDSPSRLALQPDVLNVRIRNAGESNVKNLSVKLNLNGVQRAVATTSVASNSYNDVQMHFTNGNKGHQLARVSIENYPITYDDNYYLSFNLGREIKVLCINGSAAPKHVAKVLKSEVNFKVTEVASGSLDYSSLAETDLLICNEVSVFSSGMTQELMRFVSEGGSLLLLPSTSDEQESTNELLLAVGANRFSGIDSVSLKVEGVNLQSSVFKNVFTTWEDRIDLPTVKNNFRTNQSTNSLSEQLLTLENGSSLLASYKLGKGKSYVLSSTLRDEWSNFHRHALFVPTIYNIALNSVSNTVSAEEIGSLNSVSLASKDAKREALQVQSTTDATSFVPEQVVGLNGVGLLVHNQVKKAGHYFVKNGESDTLQSISFNYNRLESDMHFLTIDELTAKAESAGISNIQFIEGSSETIANQVQELHDGKQLWRWFLLLVLLALLIETLLIRIL